jgi:large subunit ribosomal protein L22
MEVKAILSRTKTTPQKARLVASLIYGKNVNDAMNILQLTRKKAARIMQKVLKSALANAEENHKVLDVDDMFVKRVTVDQGVVMKRTMPRARGSADTIRKRSSNICLVLSEK